MPMHFMLLTLTVFLVGLLGDEPIATISVVKYGSSFGFLGFYIVKPEYRGQGYGIQIWNAGMEYLSGRNVGLDGVIEQQENYKKSGFKLAYSNIRYEGGQVPIYGESGEVLASGEQVVDLASIPFSTVEGYDRDFFPENREVFLKHWLLLPESKGLGIMQDGKLAGYGVIRKCRTGYKIGPLFADSANLAESLFLALKKDIEPDQPVYLDVPEINVAGIAMAEKYQMQKVFGTARMYTGEFPELPIERLFGVTTFELG